MKYKTLAEFKVAFDAGKHPGAFIVIDNDGVWVQVEGEEEDVNLWESEGPRDALHEAFACLGLPSQDV